MTSIDNLAEEIMQGLQEYADLADTAMKKAVRKSATQVKNEISVNAPKDTGKYAKSWATKKTGENSHSLEMTVHSKNRYQLAHLLEKDHAKRGGGRVSGKPHIAPAEENGVQLLEHLIEGRCHDLRTNRRNDGGNGTAFRLPSFCRGRKPCTAFSAVLISRREYVFGR